MTYAEKISSEDRRLDLTQSAEDLAAKVRALTPHIGAFLEIEGGERLGVREARAVDADSEGDLLVPTGDGLLRLDVVQPAGGKAMSVADYLRGRPVPTFA